MTSLCCNAPIRINRSKGKMTHLTCTDCLKDAEVKTQGGSMKVEREMKETKKKLDYKASGGFSPWLHQL